jgi:hypothetical protein
MAFGALLVLVGLALGIHEIRNPIRLSGLISRRRRRTLGATVLCVLGGMIGNGKIPQGVVPKEVLMNSAYYWLGVMLLTLVLVGLAIWDTLEGVRALNAHLDVAEGREIQKLQQHLAQADSR